MAAIKSVAAIAEKWARVTPQRTADYEAGVRQPTKDWQKLTAAANEGWKAGIQAAVQQDRFIKGVNRAGTAKWQQGSIEKGLQRWGPGVQLGEDAYTRGFAPYREAIASVNLPARFARRDPRNLDRVKAVVEALKRVKESLGS